MKNAYFLLALAGFGGFLLVMGLRKKKVEDGTHKGEKVGDEPGKPVTTMTRDMPRTAIMTVSNLLDKRGAGASEESKFEAGFVIQQPFSDVNDPREESEIDQTGTVAKTSTLAGVPVTLSTVPRTPAKDAFEGTQPKMLQNETLGPERFELSERTVNDRLNDSQYRVPFDVYGAHARSASLDDRTPFTTGSQGGKVKKGD